MPTAKTFHHPHIAAPVVIRVHPRARRISLRFKAASHEVILTLPRRAPVAQGMQFLEQKKSWLQQVIARHPAPAPLQEGCFLTVLGENYVLRHHAGRGTVTLEGNVITICGAAEFMERRLNDWLKKHLLAYIMPRAERLAQTIGKRIARISVRDTQTLWGSCSRKGNLSFALRLVYTPPAVVDYIIAHEVAHLAQMNHGPGFWKLVEQLCPNYKTHRSWLRGYGRVV